MNIDDFISSTSETMNTDIDNMDVSLNYDNPELMTSEFFDSVLSLESKLEDDLFGGIQDDLNLSSDNCSNTEDVLSPQSFYSESASDNADDPVSLLPGLENYDVPMLMSLLDPVQNAQIDKQTTSTVKTAKPTKILIQNPNNKKIITKPLLYTGQVKNSSKAKPQILKVQSVTNGGRPVFLPLNVKSIKILNSNTDLQSINNVKKRKQMSDEEDVNIVSSTESQYQPLTLTAEEKRLLAKEGIQLPTHHPLTKNEERELKRIRRKIRNKISAQDSRKRKKEYIDGLEERVKRGSEENKNLLQRVKELQKQNKHLIAQVSKLQALICKSTTSKATPSTCLMVVLLSALLVSLPNIKLFEKQQVQSAEQEQIAVRRSLLSSPADDENLNMEEFLVFKDDNVEFDGKIISEDMLENATGQEFTKLINEMNKKYDAIISDKNNSKNSVFGSVVETIKHFLDRNGNAELNDYGGYQNKRGFVEPEVDDDDPGEPASKRIKRNIDDFDIKTTGNTVDEKIVSTTLNTRKLVINSKNK